MSGASQKKEFLARYRRNKKFPWRERIALIDLTLRPEWTLRLPISSHRKQEDKIEKV